MDKLVWQAYYDIMNITNYGAETMKLNQTFKNIKRLQQIVAVFVRHGFSQVVEAAGLDRFIKGETYDQKEKLSAPVRLRMAFEELGTTFVKLGQMLSIRPDLVPREFVEEFVKLQDKVSAVGMSEIRGQIERELDTKLENVYANFQQECIGSASIGQVHRARLIDGREVVVKVRKAGIEDIIETDLSILFILANLLDRYFLSMAVINPVAIVDEFARTIHEELDFIHEAQNLKRFRDNFEENENVVIPDVVWEFTGKRVLTMEYLDGVPLNDVQTLTAKGHDLKKLADIGIESFFQMVFEDGFFHGDIHGGNILVLKGDRIGIIDCGVAGRLDDRLLEEVASLFIALVMRDFRAMARSYLRMSILRRDSISPEALARDLNRIIEPIMGLELNRIDSRELMLNLAGIAQKHRLQVPQELLLLFRAIISLETMGRDLDPEFDVLAAASKFARRVVIDRYRPERLLVDLVGVLRDLADLGRDMPSQLSGVLRQAEAGNLGIDVKVREKDTVKLVKREVYRIVFAILTAGGAVTVGMTHGSGSVGISGVIGSMTFLSGVIGLGYLILSGKRG